MNKRDDFLKKTLPDYLKAMIAVREFRQMIQDECEKVLKKKAPALASAIGLKSNHKKTSAKFDAEPYDYSIKDWDRDWNGRSGWLSAYIQLNDPRGKLARLDSGIYWDVSDEAKNEIWACTCIYTTHQGFVEVLRNSFKDKLKTSDSLTLEYSPKDYEISISAKLRKLDLGGIKKDLETTLCKWIDLWGEVGGLKSVHSRK